MRYRTRRFLFYTLAICFPLVGTFIVAYSLGYTFNFSTASFESTGGIFIKSATPRLAVFLDGAFVRETGVITGSTILTDLRPGRHLVRLEKPEHRPWSKTVNVESTAVTELRDIILVPYEPVAATSTPAAIRALQATTTSLEPLTIDKKGTLIAGRGGEANLIAKNVHSFATVGDTVYFVGQNGFLASYDQASRELATVGRPGFFLNRKPVRFISGPGLIAVIDSAGGLFTFNESTNTLTPLAAEVKDASLDDLGQKLLIRKEEGIQILWLKDNERQPFQKKGKLEAIVELGGAVRDAYWFYAANAHIVYRTAEGIFITEVDGRGGRNTSQLLAGSADELLTFPSLPNAIFYRTGKTVYKIEL